MDSRAGFVSVPMRSMYDWSRRGSSVSAVRCMALRRWLPVIVVSLFTGNTQCDTYSASRSVTVCLLPFKDMHRFFVHEEPCLEVDNADIDLVC